MFVLKKAHCVALIFILSTSFQAWGNSHAPRLTQTWSEVFALRTQLMEKEAQTVTEQSAWFQSLTKSPTESLLSYDDKQHLLAITKKVTEILKPTELLLQNRNQPFRSHQRDDFLKGVVLQLTHFASALRLSNWIVPRIEVGLAFRGEKGRPEVQDLYKIVDAIEFQLSRLEKGSGLRQTRTAIQSNRLKIARGATLQLLAEEFRFVATQIKRNSLIDPTLQEKIIEVLKQDLQSITEEQNQFISATRRFLQTRRSLVIGIRSMFLYGISDIYLPRDHDISDAQIQELEQSFEPGDIALIKHKYKLTNVGIKGDWNHSVLLIGNPEKLAHFFDKDEETNKVIRELCERESLNCHNLTSYLREKHPATFERFIQGETYLGKPIDFYALESKKNGVIFSNIFEAIRKDQLVVFRPQLSRKDRALAIAIAFENIGKKYDYDFDLRSSDRLICTELIIFAYAESAKIGKKGLSFAHSQRGDRPLAYPDDIYKTYQQGLGDLIPPLSLVIEINKP